MRRIGLKELTGESFEKDIFSVLEISDPEAISKISKKFNTKKGISIPDEQELIEFLASLKGAIRHKSLLALLKISIFLRSESIDKNIEIDDIVEELKEYAKEKGKEIPENFIGPLKLLIEPKKEYLERRKAIKQIEYAFDTFISMEYRNELKIVRDDGSEFVVPVVTMKLTLRDPKGETNEIYFQVDDEEVNKLVDDLSKCRKELIDMIEDKKNKLDIYRVSVDE